MKHSIILFTLLSLFTITHTANDLDPFKNGTVACCIGLCCIALTTIEPLPPVVSVFSTGISNVCIYRGSAQCIKPQPLEPSTGKQCTTSLALACLPCLMPNSVFPCGPYKCYGQTCNQEASKVCIQGCFSAFCPHQSKAEKLLKEAILNQN